ncbi:MAG: flagellar hook-length control protein FliK [Gallionella sp.]|jgi:flagellar hook-length control protein FliK
MINQILTSPPANAKNKLTKSDAGAAQNDNSALTGKQGKLPIDPFGSLLARQIADQLNVTAEPILPIAPLPELLISSFQTAPSRNRADNAEPLVVAPADQATNPLAAMLFGVQTLPVTPVPVQETVLRSSATGSTIQAQPDLASLPPATPLDATATAAVPANLTQPEPIRPEVIPAGADTLFATSQPPALQTPALQAPAPQPANNQASIAAPLGSHAWPEEFTQKINWVSTQQNQVAELHLNPPELGPMSVVLTVADNQASAVFSSAHSAVREAIENALPKLRESLAENGIMLGNATVNDQSPRESNAGNFMQQRANNRTQTEEAAQDIASVAVPVATRRHNGMVDTFA